MGKKNNTNNNTNTNTNNNNNKKKNTHETLEEKKDIDIHVHVLIRNNSLLQCFPACLSCEGIYISANCYGFSVIY